MSPQIRNLVTTPASCGRSGAPGAASPNKCLDGGSLAHTGPSPYPDIEAFITSMCTQVRCSFPASRDDALASVQV